MSLLFLSEQLRVSFFPSFFLAERLPNSLRPWRIEPPNRRRRRRVFVGGVPLLHGRRRLAGAVGGQGGPRGASRARGAEVLGSEQKPGGSAKTGGSEWVARLFYLV